jgi:hypothetical protein
MIKIITTEYWAFCGKFFTNANAGEVLNVFMDKKSIFTRDIKF